MTSRKRRHGASASRGSNADDGICDASDGGMVSTIKSVRIDKNGAAEIVLQDHAPLNVLVVQEGKGAINIESLKRAMRRKRQRERERRQRNPESAEKAEERRQAEEQKRQAEAAERLEQRRQRYIEQNGEDISTANFKRVEEDEIQQRRQHGRSSIDASGQARIHAYFRPKSGGDAVESLQSEVETFSERRNTVLVGPDSEERGEPALTPVVPTEEEQTRVPEKMYLRLAFLRKDEIDKMKATPAGTEIRKAEMIGPVLVEDLNGESTVKVDASQFLSLRDPDKRNGGKEIGANKFKALKQALADADWKVDRKYLSKRYRAGENNDWTPDQVKIVIGAVERMSGTDSKQHWADAARFLKDTYGMAAGYDWQSINAAKVKHVYTKREKLLDESGKLKVGRPRLLSPECEEALNAFIQKRLGDDASCKLSDYVDDLDKILKEHNEAEAFYDACKDPKKYLRGLIRNQKDLLGK